ncbi:MAG: Holliday junction resolvase RuvX [Aquiluna sp.]
MIALGIDVGQARVGVAFNQGSLVMAHGVIQRTSDAAKEIASIAADRKAERLFVGLPVSLSGSNTRSTSDAMTFARELAREVGLPVYLIDERLSTVSANLLLRSAGKSAKQSKSIIDAEAARVILESALSGAKTQSLEEFDA